MALHRLAGRAGVVGPAMRWDSAKQIELPATADVCVALHANAGVWCVHSDGEYWESPQPADVCAVAVIVAGRVHSGIRVWSRATATVAEVTAAAVAAAATGGVAFVSPVLTGHHGAPLRRGRPASRWLRRPQRAELRERGPATGRLKKPLAAISEEAVAPVSCSGLAPMAAAQISRALHLTKPARI